MKDCKEAVHTAPAPTALRLRKLRRLLLLTSRLASFGSIIDRSFRRKRKRTPTAFSPTIDAAKPIEAV
jgi:hypothetical protein